MALFIYKATDSSGKVTKSTVEAVDESVAVTRIQAMGLIPIRISPAGSQRQSVDAVLSNPLSGLRNRITGKDLMLFTQDMATLLEAGLPIDRSLSILMRVVENKKLNRLIKEILKSLTVAQIQELPFLNKQTILPDYLDVMGHMNIRYYLGLFDDSAWNLFASFGMDQAYYENKIGGSFALQQFIQYLAEVHVHETVAIHGRLIGRSAKRIHFMLFMINETTGKVAATLETLGSHADLQQRRTSPFPENIAARIDEMLAAHNQLDWQPPLSGAMSPLT